MKTKLLSVAIAAILIVLSFYSCEVVKIPIKEFSVVSDYSLPPFAPDSLAPGTAGTGSFPLYPYGTTRVNTPGLSIASAYTTADGIDHVVLHGTINSGIYGGVAIEGTASSITDGLFWDQNSSSDPNSDVPYSGRGDFHVNSCDYPGTWGAPLGGSAALPIREIDLSMEWKSKGPYTVVTLAGLVAENEKDVEIIERNDSLNLWNKAFREAPYPYGLTFFPSDYVEYRRNRYTENPNLFPNSFQQSDPHIANGAIPDKRGGFSFFISDAAKPKTATFEINYRNGNRKTVVVDYNQVRYREVDIISVSLGAGSSGTLTKDGGINPPDPESEDDLSTLLTYTGSVSHNYPLTFTPFYTRSPEIAPTDLRPPTNSINSVRFVGDEEEDPENILLAKNLEYLFNDLTGEISIYLKYPSVEPNKGKVYVDLHLRNPCYYKRTTHPPPSPLPETWNYYYDKISIHLTIN